MNITKYRWRVNASSIPWLKLFQARATWALFTGKLLTDPIWWFMLFWLPSYFNARYHLDLSHLGLPLVIVYVATSIGSIGGGWISSSLINKGWAVSKARQTTMLYIAFLVTPIALAPWIDFSAHSENGYSRIIEPMPDPISAPLIVIAPTTQTL